MDIAAHAYAAACFPFRRAHGTVDFRLFCFPYAGGESRIFRSWDDALPPWVEVCAVELPGHGTLRRLPALPRLSALVDVVSSALTPHLDRPFGFFGHSMGALLAFELARHFRRQCAILLVSGRRAPQLRERERNLHALTDAELIEGMRKFNGLPRVILENPELMAFYLPVFRADLAVCETYEYTDEPPLECPVAAFGGIQDRTVEQAALKQWSAQTRSVCTIHMFPGDHFFLHTSRELCLAEISRALTRARSVAP
jgi:medium-chain acyl-[acyl-carrier-protein] hydrolase